MKTSSLYLKDQPTLQDFQRYVAQMVDERGFHQESIAETFVLFIEECGELAKAIREKQKINVAADAAEKISPMSLRTFFFILLILQISSALTWNLPFARKKRSIKSGYGNSKTSMNITTGVSPCLFI